MKLFPDEQETIEGVGRALRDGRTTCVDVVRGCLSRIAEAEPGIQAWVVVDHERALSQAARCDAELASGIDRGPLHGIPIGVKDIVDVESLPTAAGFRPWAGRVALADAPVVGRLRESGAIILGKTVTTQFAWVDPPVTRNPWNSECTPGGSSSGSAAAVAAGMSLAAVGTQTGGSIIRPSSFCGVFGFKPRHGDLPLDGIVPFAPNLDHPGPIARSVTDLWYLYSAMSGRAAEGQIQASLRESDQPPHLIRIQDFFDAAADAEMHTAMAEVARWFAEAHATVEDAPLPAALEDVHYRHRIIMASEAAAQHAQRFSEHGDDYQPMIASLVTEGLKISTAEYTTCKNHQTWLREGSPHTLGFEPADILLTPATLGPAPDPSTTGDPRYNSPWSYSGLPTISIPVGLSSARLPLAIQLTGCGDEETLFRAALWCEGVIRRASRARSD